MEDLTQSKKERKKPIFFGKIFTYTTIILDFVVNIISPLKISNNMDNWEIIIIEIIIFIISIIIAFIVNLIMYSVKLYRYSSILENENKSLNSFYNKKIIESENLKRESMQYRDILDNIKNILEFAITSPSNEETHILEKILQIVFGKEISYDNEKKEK